MAQLGRAAAGEIGSDEIRRALADRRSGGNGPNVGNRFRRCFATLRRLDATLDLEDRRSIGSFRLTFQILIDPPQQGAQMRSVARRLLEQRRQTVAEGQRLRDFLTPAVAGLTRQDKRAFQIETEPAPLRRFALGWLALEDLALKTGGQTQLRRQPYRFLSPPRRTVAARMVPVVGFLLADHFDTVGAAVHLSAGRTPGQRRTFALKGRPLLPRADASVRQGDEGRT